MPQVHSFSTVQKIIVALFQHLVNVPGMHRIARFVHSPLFGSKRYYCSYLKRFRFILDTQTGFGFLTGLGLHHREIDQLLGVLFGQIATTKIVFFDVGANEGFVTLLAHSQAQRVGCALDAHCFDPNPYAFAPLQQNIQLNAFQVHAYQTAIGSSAEQQEMLFTKDSVNSTLLSDSVQGAITRSVVPVTTLDQFCAEHDLVPEVIKIDVEGYELSVLEGAEQTLLQHKPFLVAEVNPRMLVMGGNSVDALILRLRELSYNLYYVDSKTARVIKPRASLSQGLRWHGYYAVEEGDQVGKYLWDVLAVPQQAG